MRETPRQCQYKIINQTPQPTKPTINQTPQSSTKPTINQPTINQTPQSSTNPESSTKPTINQTHNHQPNPQSSTTPRGADSLVRAPPPGGALHQPSNLKKL